MACKGTWNYRLIYDNETNTMHLGEAYYLNDECQGYTENAVGFVSDADTKEEMKREIVESLKMALADIEKYGIFNVSEFLD